MRDPWTDFLDSDFDFGVTLNSVPHTTQRVAFSVTRVPHVGQSLVEIVSGLIIRALYHVENEKSRKIEFAHNHYILPETSNALAL